MVILCHSLIPPLTSLIHHCPCPCLSSCSCSHHHIGLMNAIDSTVYREALQVPPDTAVPKKKMTLKRYVRCAILFSYFFINYLMLSFIHLHLFSNYNNNIVLYSFLFSPFVIFSSSSPPLFYSSSSPPLPLFFPPLLFSSPPFFSSSSSPHHPLSFFSSFISPDCVRRSD